MHRDQTQPRTTFSRLSTGRRDLDLAVDGTAADGSEVLVGQSATEVANETVQPASPLAGTYRVVVSGYADVPGTTSTPYVHTPAVVTTAESDLTVTPTGVLRA